MNYQPDYELTVLFTLKGTEEERDYILHRQTAAIFLFKSEYEALKFSGRLHDECGRMTFTSKEQLVDFLQQRKSGGSDNVALVEGESCRVISSGEFIQNLA